MKMIKNAVKGLIVAFALALALPAGANAGNESLTSSFSLAPQEGSFFSDAFKAANWSVENTVSVPAEETEILPSKVIDIGNPEGEMTFNPGDMPVCGDEIGPGNVNAPVDVVVARCPDSVLGNGTGQFAFNRVPTVLIDFVIVAFNGGLSGGDPLVKVYSYSYDTAVGLYTEAALTDAGRLRFEVPSLQANSAVTTFNLAIPGQRQVLSGIDPGGGDVILPGGEKDDYVQAKCSNGQHRWDNQFTFGTRDTDGNPTSPDTFASDSGSQSCSGSPAPIPETTIRSGPSGTISADEASFEFFSSEIGSTFECELDGGGFSPCSSPKSYAGLTEGAHSFAVKATAPTGKTDPSPAIRSFTVDTILPETQIDSGPDGATDDTTPTFGFSASEHSSFECRLYLPGLTAPEFTACSGPGDSHTAPGALPDADYVFEVRATDTAGNADPTPATRSFTVDTTPPDTAIDSGPTGTIKTNEATFTFSGTPASDTAKIQCRIDSGPFADCTSPKTFAGLTDGPHTVDFRAEDAIGNRDPTPATRSFTVDTTVYRAKIKRVRVSGPAKVKKGKKATYKVKITSSGNATATGVRLKVKGRGISFNASVGKISAGKTRTTKVKLKARKPGKVKVTFKVTSKNAGGKTVKKKIRVKK